MKEASSKFLKPPYIKGIACCVGVLFIIGILFWASGKVASFFYQPEPEIDYSSIDSICELATLKSYYHNVLTLDKDGNFLNEMFNENHYWIEYTAIIEAGVDASKIERLDSDEDDIVKMYIPDAEVFTVNVDPDSFSEPVTDKGIIKSIKTKEKVQELSNVQEALRENAEKDETLLKRAKENAMKLIEDYIITVGKAVGRNYTVEWVSK